LERFKHNEDLAFDLRVLESMIDGENLPFLFLIMVVQYAVWHPVGDQFNRTDLFGGTLIHQFNHLAGEFGMTMIM
jgi:hypothetical protein